MASGAAAKVDTPFRTEQFPVCSEFLAAFEFKPQSLRQSFSSRKGKARPATEMCEVPMHTANTLPLCLDQRVLERTCLERKRCGAAKCFIFIFRHETKTGFQGWINGPVFTRVGYSLLLTRGSLLKNVIADRGPHLPDTNFLTKIDSTGKETTGRRSGLRTSGLANEISSRSCTLMTQVTILVWLPHSVSLLMKIGLRKELPSPPTSIGRRAATSLSQIFVTNITLRPLPDLLPAAATGESLDEKVEGDDASPAWRLRPHLLLAGYSNEEWTSR